MWRVETFRMPSPRGAAVLPRGQSRMRSVLLCADSLPPFCSQGSRGDPGDAGPRGESGQPGPKVCPLPILQDGAGSLTKSSRNLPAQPPWCGRTSGAEQQPPPPPPFSHPWGWHILPKRALPMRPLPTCPQSRPAASVSTFSHWTCPDWPPVFPRETLAGLDSAIPAPEEHL